MQCTYLHLDESLNVNLAGEIRDVDKECNRNDFYPFVSNFLIEALNPTLLIGWKCDLWFVSTDQKLQGRL